MITNARYTSNEVRLVSTTSGPLSVIAGAYFFQGHSSTDPLISFPNGVATTPSAIQQTTTSTAVFGEATWRLSDQLRLIGGLRYTDEKRTLTARTATTILVPEQKGGNDKLTYRASLQYFISPETNLFATYSRGFKSGVYNTFATSPTTAKIVRPEVLDAVELGLKSDPLPWLRVNLSAFHYNYKDIQQTARDPATGFTVLFNAACSKMIGLEAEVTARATDNLNLRAYATYLDAKYDSFPGAQVFRPAACPATLPGRPSGHDGMVAA